jgi:hypothetical protein
MSYDVGIGDFSANYTSNVSGLWYDHIPNWGNGGGLHEINGKTGKQALQILSDAIDCMWRNDIDQLKRYDAPNGWGSTQGALIFTARILAACAANPRKKVRVYA